MRLLSPSVKLADCLSLAMLVGCSSLPEYTFQSPSQPRAQVRTLDEEPLTLCKNGERYSLRAMPGQTTSPVYEVPAGEKIALVGSFYVDDGNMVYSCRPRIAFKPVEGERYIFDQVLVGRGCGAHIAREDSSYVVGVAPEFSLSRPEDSCQ